MTETDPDNHSVPPVSLADALACDAVSRLPPEVVRSLRSDVASLSRWTGIAPENLPADPPELRAEFKALSPGGLKVTKKRIANVKSGCTRLLDVCGIGTHLVHKAELSEHWVKLIGRLINRFERQQLNRLGRFCSYYGFNPYDLNDDLSDRYLKSLRLDLRVKDPKVVHRNTVLYWNRQVGHVSGWPAQVLTVPKYNNYYTLPWSTFSPSLVEAIEEFFQYKTNDDPFDLTAPDQANKPSTVKTYRDRLRRFLSALVLSGVSAASMLTLDDVLALDKIKLGLRYISHGRGKRPLAATVGGTLSLLAAFANRPEAEIEAIVQIAFNLRKNKGAKTKGLKKTIRDRLLPLKDENNLARLYLYPRALIRRVKRLPVIDIAAARLHRSAVALSIFTVCPLRRGSLCGLRLEHLHWSQPGMRGDLVIQFDEGELKENEPGTFPIPPDVARDIREHIVEYRPKFKPGASPYLFPGMDPARPRDAGSFATQLREQIFEDTGLVVNVHLFRHIVHLIVLRRFPGAYALVARVLHHSSLSTTLANYAAFDAEIALAAYQKMVGEVQRSEVKEPDLQHVVYLIQETPRHGR